MREILAKALIRILAGDLVLDLVKGYKLKKEPSSETWDIYDHEGNLVVEKFIHMYHYKKDPSGVLSLLHPSDLPPALKGQGLGISSYAALAKHYGKFRSDTSLTDDGEAVWRRLVNQGYEVEVVTHDYENMSKDQATQTLKRMWGESVRISPDLKYDPDTYFSRLQINS